MKISKFVFNHKQKNVILKVKMKFPQRSSTSFQMKMMNSTKFFHNKNCLNATTNFFISKRYLRSSTNDYNEEEEEGEEEGYFNSEDELNNIKKEEEEIDVLDSIPLETADDHYRRALILKEQGKIKKALKHLEEAIKKDSTDYRYYTMRGSCYEDLNKFQLAINDYTRVTNTQPQNYPAFLATAQCYMKIGEVSKN
jgi:tetratricopeptide (TPR) repeat protein